jgi:hypothetical protein
MTTKNKLKRLSATLAASFATLAVGASAAQAELSFEPGSVVGDLSSQQAGAHPDFHTAFSISKDGEGKPLGAAKTIETVLPKGMLGNPTATAQCTAAQVASLESPLGPCPANTVVGVVTFVIGDGYGGFYSPVTVFLHNVKPYANQPAAMMFSAMIFPIRIDTSVRSDGDYNIKATATNVSEGQPLVEFDMTIWGVPADHQGPGELSTIYGQPYGGPLLGAPRKPFLTNPSVCDGNLLTTTYDATPWNAQPNPVPTATASSPAVSGCEKQVFAPGAQVRPASKEAGSASSYDITLTVPQSESPDGVATPPVKDVSMTLPKGTTLSPAAADGLGACSDAQVALKSTAPEQCPDSSKVGSVKIDTPLLEDPLTGSLYQGTQLSNDPQSGKMYRLFLVAYGSGVRIKLEGSVKVDPASGQVTASFTDNPQLPFERLEVHLNGGSRAPLVTPPNCGAYATHAELTSWSAPGEVKVLEPSFTINQGCGKASQFTPQLQAGTTNPVGGSYSPFTLRVTRPDGQQNIAAISTTLPEGLLAKLAGVGICGEAQAATGACPASSQVGSATVGAGAGTSPLYVPQPGKSPTAVYLAGPYKGGPYSLVAKVPAQAGPFDLGTVAVRNSIKVDPVSTQVAVQSDPLPQILKGIPVSYRDIRVEVDKPGFTLNPTSCDPMQVTGSIGSASGASVPVSDRFQVADCASLGFKPKLALRFSGPTNRSAHPKLRATLTMPEGANVQKAAVTLPKTEFLENAHIKTICTRVQYAVNACPAQSIYGYAKAWTPLLDQPLQGPVYLRSSNHELPDLVASLDGAIHVDLAGRIDSVNSRIRNTFEMVPDAPVSKFELTMQGGKKGLLVNNTDLCKTKPRASVLFDGHNGKVHDTQPLVKTDCGKARKGKKHKK